MAFSSDIFKARSLLKEKPSLTEGWNDHFRFPWSNLVKILTLYIRRRNVSSITPHMGIIYKSTRIGLNGKPFTLYKFRTMCEDADLKGGPNTPSDDPRLTRIGKWLRRYNLDELPQLWNIIKGEMNIVGPRPEVPEYVNLMTRKEKKIILSVRPGLTDLATLENTDEGSRLKGFLDPEKVYLNDIRPEKIKLQMEYVETKSICTDIKIVLKTIWRIFVRR